MAEAPASGLPEADPPDADLPEAGPAALSAAQYAALAAFRYRLRRFLAFSEAAALQAGLPPQQHQALLALAGHRGRTPPTVGLLAEQLLIAPHSAAELVARMEEAGLIGKRRSAQDRRRTELALTPRAEALLGALTEAHLRELRTMKPALLRALDAGGAPPEGEDAPEAAPVDPDAPA